MITRCFSVLALLLALLWPAGPATANGKVEGGEIFVKMQPVMLEMWDDYGVFHQISIEMMVVSPVQITIPKTVSTKIKQTLQALPFIEIEKGESSAMIKKTALDFIHAQPGCGGATEILITKIMVK